MLPEMAISYVVGTTASVSLSGLHIFLFKQKIKTKSFVQLQSNLAQCELFWSETESNIKAAENLSLSELKEKDQQQYIKSVLLSGALFAALSWIGFFLQLLMMASIRYWAVSRRERQIFESDLVLKDHSKDYVLRSVDELSKLV